MFACSPRSTRTCARYCSSASSAASTQRPAPIGHISGTQLIDATGQVWRFQGQGSRHQRRRLALLPPALPPPGSSRGTHSNRMCASPHPPGRNRPGGCHCVGRGPAQIRSDSSQAPGVVAMSTNTFQRPAASSPPPRAPPRRRHVILAVHVEKPGWISTEVRTSRGKPVLAHHRYGVAFLVPADHRHRAGMSHIGVR